MADILGVQALNLYVKSILEDNKILNDIAVEGEITNFVNHFKTGHYYFALKEKDSVIKTVMFSFNNKKLTFIPENGMKVIIRGKVSLYERDGTYQLYATDIFLSGVGARHIAFEQLKEKLKSEGLFDESHKKSLPRFPFKIGIATSATGAALQDIISVAKRRFPCVEISLAPCLVQGDIAEKSIVESIKTLDNKEGIELIIIARGGGSAEDLWVFNSEEIARTVFNCKKPTISAIGHEIDFSILDFVCDVRAATPTAAAEIALPDISSINMQLYNYENSITKSAKYKLENYSAKLKFIASSKGFSKVSTSTTISQAKLDSIKETMKQAIAVKINSNIEKIKHHTQILENQNPLNLLKTGYSLVYDENNNLIKEQLAKKDDYLLITTFKQKIKCQVVDTKARKD